MNRTRLQKGHSLPLRSHRLDTRTPSQPLPVARRAVTHGDTAVPVSARSTAATRPDDELPDVLLLPDSSDDLSGSDDSDDFTGVEPPRERPLPPPGSPGRPPALRLARLGRDILPVYERSADILHTARAESALAPDIERASRRWQFTYNYFTGAGVYSSSFAIGSLVAATVSPLNPVAGAVLFDLVAPLLHGSLGEAVGMMIRKNRGAAYGSPDTEAWRACSDALADWLRARCAGDAVALPAACERFNTEVLKLWQRWGRPTHTAHLGEPETLDLRSQLIDLRTPLKAMGMGFLVDEVAFVWFAIAYAGAGRVAVTLLERVAQGASAWGLREAYRFSMFNGLNHLAWGAFMGGSMTTVQQNAMRSLVYPDAAQPDGGVQSRRVRHHKLDALGACVQRLQAQHDALREEARQREATLAEGAAAHDEVLLVLQEAMALIDASIAQRENEMRHLEQLGGMRRHQRDDQTFRANLRTLFSPALRRNQLARMAGNVLCLAPYVERMRSLAQRNAAHAQALVAAQQGGPVVTLSQTAGIEQANTFMGSQLIAFWYGRTFLQTGLKLGHAIGAGLWAGWRGAPVGSRPADEVLRMPSAVATGAAPPGETVEPAPGPGSSDDSTDSSGSSVDCITGVGSEGTLDSPVGAFVVPDHDPVSDGLLPPIRSTLDERLESLMEQVAALRAHRGDAHAVAVLSTMIDALSAEIAPEAAASSDSPSVNRRSAPE